MITAGLLMRATGCTAAAAERFAAPLAAACDAYQITSPKRLAAFLAQIGHESGSLRFVSELWGPTPAQQRYEGRADLGNTQPGDGSRYRGRGLIQTTGRYNYARVRDRLRARLVPNVPDFEQEAEALEQPQWAALSAADYWGDRDLNTLADVGDFETITRKVNGGLNGYADRKARWARAQAALGPSATPAPQPATTVATTVANAPTSKEFTMPLPAFIAAALPAIISAIPQLGKLFGSGSDVAERNIKAAELAVQIVQDATGARNAQEAVDTIKADPAALQAATQAIQSRWLELDEAGGGGIAGARKADTEARAAGDLLRSPSFWIAGALLPIVYIIVLSLIGIIGTAEWASDVRAGLAGSIVSAIIGGVVGYYFGQTTSRNRTPAP
jgi:putative chitinase